MGFWKTREQIRESQRVHTQGNADTAGDAGEQDVKDVVDRIITHHGAGLGVRTFGSLRVPQLGSKQKKYEIDLLIAGPYGLIGIEAKNPGGAPRRRARRQVGASYQRRGVTRTRKPGRP